jgi:diguanylate cyclase (GGDEF)-like protein
MWSVENLISPPLPAGVANTLLFISCAMIWNAARLFHGRRVLWGGLIAGAAIWLVACMITDFAEWTVARIALSSMIVAAYTFLTSAELWRERRRHLLRRWPALFVPMAHGAVFLCPIPLAGLLPSDGGIVTLASGWLTVFVLEIMLYAVGTAFVGLALAKERAVRIHKDAASTDDLTGLLNRRGLLEAAQMLVTRKAKENEAVSVLMFDLDHFKSINDRFGHGIGDATLRLFGATVIASMRATDLVGRFGGEEFAAVIPGTLDDALTVAERVRKAFETAAFTVAGCLVEGTVSIGAASGAHDTQLATLLASADAALYCAKSNGRNRVEAAAGAPDVLPAGEPALAWHVAPGLAQVAS